MPRLTYANVTSSLALFLALGGTSVAASNAISGSRIKAGSIPANRIKKGSLTATQIDMKKLGPVPSAVNANGAVRAGTAAAADRAATADRAASAGTADRATTADHATSADRAGDATTVQGQAPTAFMPANRVLIGNADTSTASTVTYFDDAELGFRLETDGVAGPDDGVTLRNTGSTLLTIVGTSSVGNMQPGTTGVLRHNNSPIAAADSHEVRFILQRAADPGHEALVDCLYPGAGAGKVLTVCTATHTP